jgi:SAM-dependent methyltransferase
LALYDTIGQLYSHHRQPDPRIAAQVVNALGDARTIVNVGAGTGSYEPSDRMVVAVEPSTVMIDQRAVGAAPAVQGVAESLPFADGTFDVATAFITIHHWPDWRAGLTEMRRVARRVLVLTFDPDVHDDFWLLRDYVRHASANAAGHDVSFEDIRAALGGPTRVDTVLVPHDCCDGFNSAYWRRPESYLDPDVRACISGLARLSPDELEPGLTRLADDLRTGEWHRRYADLLDQEWFDGGWRLITTT